MYNPITIDFDSNNPNWLEDNQYNLMFLKAQENYANNLLIVNGFVTLNEVLDMLGLPRTAEGINSGWVKDHGRINFRTSTEPGKMVVTLYVTDNVSESLEKL